MGLILLLILGLLILLRRWVQRRRNRRNCCHFTPLPSFYQVIRRTRPECSTRPAEASIESDFHVRGFFDVHGIDEPHFAFLER